MSVKKYVSVSVIRLVNQICSDKILFKTGLMLQNNSLMGITEDNILKILDIRKQVLFHLFLSFCV